MKFLSILFIGLILSFSRPAKAQDNGDAAANATNPLAFVTKLQVQPNFTWKGDGARQINLTSRIIQPTATIGLPFIKSKNPEKVYTIYRLELPLIGQTFPESPQSNGTGLGDLVLLDAVVFKQKWGLLGVGPGFIIPTMNPSQISGQKWGVGPAMVALNTRTKGLQWGALAQQYFTSGGNENRPNQSFMLFQPIFNKILGGGKFVQFNPIMNFNWTNKTYNIPISVAFGKAFAKNLSVFIAPEVMLSGPNQGDFTLRFQLNAMFPPSGK
ncbi:hypothetical protein Aoki45_34160 [Algoriphagus sp. oki45]|uniref:hypothetical protein n=1 Tax=Algoriphagus sp. oki45 TaxID=3067294 RepID=UPI0027FE6906|nr:hypothetical protein Aoki45_34160 [Algoriphagus sp. oki45]